MCSFEQYMHNRPPDGRKQTELVIRTIFCTYTGSAGGRSAFFVPSQTLEFACVLVVSQMLMMTMPLCIPIAFICVCVSCVCHTVLWMHRALIYTATVCLAGSRHYQGA